MNRGELIDRCRTWAKRGSADELPFDDIFDDAYQVISREVNPIDLDVWARIDTSAPTEIRSQVWQYDLPTDLIDPFHVTNNNDRLRSLRSDKLLADYGTRTDATPYRPAFYAIVGRAIWLAPGAAGELIIGYTSRDAVCPNADDSNFGTVNYPDIYAALMQAGVYNFAENTEEEEKALARYVTKRNQVNELAGAQRMGAGGRVANW